MKQYTTNYSNTFIEVAEDCPAIQGEVPPQKGDKLSVANIQYEMIQAHPYHYTSDEVIFQCHAVKNDLADSERTAAFAQYFSRGQACLRTSPLAKRYGFGIHHDAAGKVALYGRETETYHQFCADEQVKKVKAMRAKRA
ncbi:hypothetical protein DBR32_08655 [Taibaiella sp. KBW10]|uniref:DUF6157 family protein n=1 Tax=Taibaiella sp. KBW10 TaxID=2153357 RepID=UPI000F58FECF|nr:DUF6157 family protein [Taibaiella sp. KBW10]RQO30783.1 hypothetical protein DBR32_08655 [Taibaiella sp. KBW10]